jgi:hypothetical protein
MSKNRQRDILEQRAKNAETAHGMVKILMQEDVPPTERYQKLRRFGLALREELNKMSAREIGKLKRLEESREFAKRILL